MHCEKILCRYVGGACRSRATILLAKQFRSPIEAHQYFESAEQQKRCPVPERVKLHLRSCSTQTDDALATFDNMVSLMTALPEEQQYFVVNKMVQVLAARSNPAACIADDFVKLSLRAMERLKQSGRENTVYGLVRGLGIMREDGSDSRLPVHRMPMGLLEYVISFYQSESINKVFLLVFTSSVIITST